MSAFRLFKTQKDDKIKKDSKKETSLKEVQEVSETSQEASDHPAKKGEIKNKTEAFIKLIKKPILTEKAVLLSTFNKYIFEVENNANKSEIKKAIEKKYNVKVEKVNIIKSQKRKKRWLRVYSNPKKYKKAIVTLKEGYKIDLGV
ncbi:MAG: 50S ribosomal protein L23 [Candidatus Paceibacterota bacterium]